MSGFAAIATVGLSIPFVRSLFPARNPEYYKDINISSLRPGLSLRLNWRGRPLIILARSDVHLKELSQSNTDDLLDPDSVDSTQPEFALNQYLSLIHI